ncbi:MAG: hypothetical protein K9G60_14915 [Pseudolabrys sp.]|nr:hypothetical protein [Pseudolabrys sp.]
MAKAQLTTKAGTLVTIEGSTEEVASLIDLFDGAGAPDNGKLAGGEPRKTSRKANKGLASQLGSLVDDGFFKKPKEFGLIKAALEQRGHYHARTALSPALLRLVRSRELRRLKEKKHWVYVE